MEPFGDVGTLEDNVESLFLFGNWPVALKYSRNKVKRRRSKFKWSNPIQWTLRHQEQTIMGKNWIGFIFLLLQSYYCRSPPFSSCSWNSEIVQGNGQGGGVSAAVLKQLKSQTQQTPVITLLDRIFFSVLVTFLHCTKHTGAKVGSWRRRVT